MLSSMRLQTRFALVTEVQTCALPIYRIDKDPRLPSLKKAPRGRRRPDPLGGIFDSEVVPLLEARPGLRAVAIFEEMLRRHPELGKSEERRAGKEWGSRCRYSWQTYN